MKATDYFWTTHIMLIASLFGSQPGTAQHTTFEARLDSLRRVYKLPGLSAVVIHSDSIVYQGGMGYADLEQKVPAAPTTNYRIASLTKPIAATLLLQLVEADSLSLRDPIKALVPGYEDFYRHVGAYLREQLPEYAFMLEDFDFERDDLTVWHHLTHTAQYTPGDTFRYNGFLFGGLSRVMENILRMPFADIVRARILSPLSMHNSAPSQEVARPEILTLLAKPYRFDTADNKFVPVDYPEPNVNAGAGIVSNVLDLARFDQAVDHHTLISAQTQDEAWTNQRTNAGEVLPYGLGWFVQEAGGKQVVWHYGWQPESFSSLYLKLPAKELTFILLANGEGLSAPFSRLGYQRDVLVSPFARLLVDTFGDE